MRITFHGTGDYKMDDELFVQNRYVVLGEPVEIGINPEGTSLQYDPNNFGAERNMVYHIDVASGKFNTETETFDVCPHDLFIEKSCIHSMLFRNKRHITEPMVLDFLFMENEICTYVSRQLTKELQDAREITFSWCEDIGNDPGNCMVYDYIVTTIRQPESSIIGASMGDINKYSGGCDHNH